MKKILSSFQLVGKRLANKKSIQKPKNLPPETPREHSHDLNPKNFHPKLKKEHHLT